ncbi:MAG: calcium/sodium antiporter [Acholeplasmataceae bacterium]|nr:calcium/sodium antiporter [Acholeplasmataceae bacterium]
MEIWLAVILLLVGFVLLVKGADFFVDGASNIARYLKISSLIIGLTVVAFGTSLPEAAVSISGVIQGIDDVSFGNIIGSNIFNLLLILGVSALILPVVVNEEILKRDLPISILAAIIIIPMYYFLHENGSSALVRFEGLILILLLAGFMFLMFKSANKTRSDIINSSTLQDSNKSNPKEIEAPTMSKSKSIVLVLIGLIGIVAGGIMVTNGAKEIALFFGMSEWLVGLTIVSVGTSLPELVTSITAAMKKENDIAVGNVVGSNIFNLLFILGFSSLVSPVKINSTAIFDLIFLVVISIIVLIFAFRERKLGRVEGGFLTLMYLGYLVYIIIRDIPSI